MYTCTNIIQDFSHSQSKAAIVYQGNVLSVSKVTVNYFNHIKGDLLPETTQQQGKRSYTKPKLAIVNSL